MSFTIEERKGLITIKGIRNTFVNRLEKMGLDSVKMLTGASVEFILSADAEITGITCHKNSPKPYQRY